MGDSHDPARPSARYPTRLLHPRGSRDSQALVDRLIERCCLTPAMAEVALAVWHGLSQKEVARWLGKPKGTVHEHLRRIYRDSRWPEMKCRVTVALAVERVLSVAD